MRKTKIQSKPSYPLSSVDHALQLLQLLRDTGSLRLKDCAEELGVASSTAHRLLAMLVYRGFAIQDENRNYLSGPAMGEGPAHVNSSRELRLVTQPHLELLASRLNESCNLMIRVGTKVRFLATIESTNLLRVGDRRGAVLPAHRASGGKALLAELHPATLHTLYPHRGDALDGDLQGDDLNEDEFVTLTEELEQVRKRGFAQNYEGTEEGISAIGMALHGGNDAAIAAISVAMPVTRFQKTIQSGLIAVMSKAVKEIEIDLHSRMIEDSDR